MVHEKLTGRLLAARDFIEVAEAVCELGRTELGLTQSIVTLQARDGRPLITVDDCVTVTDEQRIAWFMGAWRRDPLLAAMREHQAPAGEELIGTQAVHRVTQELGYRGEYLHMLLLPILQPGELLGSIRCGHATEFSPKLRRDLTMVSSHVSVRLAQLGITTLPNPLLARLTPRQSDVAQLVARGFTNAEIGEQLQLSENTVKKHLKDIFELLEIANRTELAAQLSLGPVHDVPAGVTRRGKLWITRARDHDGQPRLASGER